MTPDIRVTLCGTRDRPAYRVWAGGGYCTVPIGHEVRQPEDLSKEPWHEPSDEPYGSLVWWIRLTRLAMVRARIEQERADKAA